MTRLYRRLRRRLLVWWIDWCIRDIDRWEGELRLNDLHLPRIDRREREILRARKAMLQYEDY